jgi:hypothetical protein
MYSAPIESEDTLHERISDTCQIIRTRPGTSERVRQSMSMRAITQVEDILSICHELWLDIQQELNSY